MLIGGVLNWISYEKQIEFTYIFVLIGVFYFIGLIQIVSWALDISWGNQFIKRTVSNLYKYLTGISKHFLVPILIGVIIAIIVVPRVISYYKISKFKKDSHAMLIKALKTDKNLSVRKAAVMALGNLKNKKYVKLMSNEMIKQPELINELSLFTREKDKEINYEMVSELQKVYVDRTLKEKDLKNRI